MNNQEIGEELDRLESESNQIKDAVINICWWMRGGISHAESWNLTEKERGNVPFNQSNENAEVFF